MPRLRQGIDAEKGPLNAPEDRRKSRESGRTRGDDEYQTEIKYEKHSLDDMKYDIELRTGPKTDTASGPDDTGVE